MGGSRPQGNRSTGAEEDLLCRSEAERESSGTKEVHSTLRHINWCATWDTGGPDNSVLEHRVQLGASHKVWERVEGMQKTATGMSRGVENTDAEEQLKDMECSVQR